MKEAVIKTEKLTKRFGDFVAVSEISFEVFPGEVFGFLGAVIRDCHRCRI